MKFETDSEVQLLMERIVELSDMEHVRAHRVFCVRSEGSTSRAVARIWSLPRVFQQCLEIEAAYVIEVMSKHWDKMSQEEQEKTMIHELLHIPKTFSGALVPHTCFGKKMVGTKRVNEFYKAYKSQM